MISNHRYIAIPPGESIKEVIEDRAISLSELAKGISVTDAHLEKLINGDVEITVDIAERLERYLGITSQFWLNLEAIYQDKKAKIKEGECK